MRASLRGGLVLVITALAGTACSSAAFDTAPAGDEPDTGAIADTGGPAAMAAATTSSDTAPVDAGGGDSVPPPIDGGGGDIGGGDGISGETGTTCERAPAAPADVCVGQDLEQGEHRDSQCPFRTIAEATGATWSSTSLHTIHVLFCYLVQFPYCSPPEADARAVSEAPTCSGRLRSRPPTRPARAPLDREWRVRSEHAWKDREGSRRRRAS